MTILDLGKTQLHRACVTVKTLQIYLQLLGKLAWRGKL